MTETTYAQESAQDLFLKIYTTIKEADKLETSGQKASARKRYEVSLARLNDLSKDYPNWEPVIVGFRKNYTEERIAALQGEEDVNPGATIAPIDPDLLNPSKAKTAAPTPPPAPKTEVDMVDNLPMEPELAEEPMVEEPANSSVTVEQSQGSEIISDRAPTIMDMEGGSESIFEPAEPAPAAVAVTPLPEDTEALKSRIRSLEEELQSTKNKLESARTEAAQLRTKVQTLESQLKVAMEGTADDKLNTLMQENEDLKERLSKAEATVASLQTGTSDTSILTLQQKIDTIQGQLELAKQENSSLVCRNAEFSCFANSSCP
ncbi:MAG: hypothetical protein AAFY98_12265 [Verrucomicrobiota bacterium]